MPSLARRAVNPTYALVAALAAFGGSPLAAQSDPFELPAGVTAQSVRPDDGPRLSEIAVDGRTRGRMVTVAGSGRELTIDADEARAAGLPVPEGASGPIKLSALRLYEWNFDSLRQRLAIKLFREGEGANLKDFAATAQGASESRPLLALRVDYDLTATIAQRRSSAGGLVSATLVYGNFALNSSARATSEPQIGSPAVLRLDTAARLAVPERGMAATLGDFVSAGSQGQRAVRMAGVQLASDFDLRPDLVTVPLPGFAGSVAVPTTIDVLTNDQRYQLGEIEPGEFTVRNVPSQPGRGEASVILLDALGREVVQTARFYVSSALLAPGTTGYAVNAGSVRRRYGFASNDYGQFAATAYFRRGLSPFLTVEASGEWTHGVSNGGVRGDYVLAKVALATIEARISRDSGAGTGTLVHAALESIGRKLGGSIRATLPSANYRDVATRLGDDPPPREYAAQFFYRFTPDTDVQLSYARQEYRSLRPERVQDRISEVLNANFRTRLSSRATFFAGGGIRRGNSGTALSAALGLSLSLGGRTNAGAYASYDDGRLAGGATYARDAQQDGEIGYRGAVNLTETSQRLSAGATWRNRRILLDGQIEEVDGVFAGRANARGTLLVAGGTVFARNQTGGSYALVRTGKVGGIPITRENVEVGVTSDNGLLLVQDIPAQATIKIDVKADKLPADALVRETTHFIRVPRRAVSLVEIETLRFRPVLRKLVNAAGVPLEAGLPVRALPSGETTIVGFDGMAEINAGADDARLMVDHPGRTCAVELTGVPLEDRSDAPLTCRAFVIAASDAESVEPASRTKSRQRRRGAAVAFSSP
ncbi:fimbrial biogenesis outer membrane usher protein [Parafrankia sp. BMG5.11]|uniref:fimbrial biogenesis outer membrane usher protein n=1 Tax=Parafrankia sp. BMG5.11 TaxID=222540 RepID=UPI00103A4E45|nr:fimbrial biogenesis outer membrane usher protein [Parafrankia sp. BMG5.11]TCJ41084.1 fimbrial biogenesis outer membrane usher protein [Parafrankia sp. BMG5.11]